MHKGVGVEGMPLKITRITFNDFVMNEKHLGSPESLPWNARFLRNKV
jgi:hypothetical protein